MTGGQSPDELEAQRKRRCDAVKKFGLGQLIALLVGAQGFFASLLADNDVYIPTVQLSLNYLVLCICLVVHVARNNCRLRTSSPWWAYAILAVIDLEANYCVTKAYQCTDFTSIMLLDCMTIPTAFLLSKAFLKAKFRATHYIGIGLCLVGISLIVVSDSAFPPTNYSTVSHVSVTSLPVINMTTALPMPPFCLHTKAVGDVLCIAGSVLYGMSNVAEEKLVKSSAVLEFIGLLGAWGFFFSIIQIAALERQEIASLDWATTDNLLYLAGFVVTLAAMYVLTGYFLRIADSTFFNIALLSSDFWAVVVSFALYHTLPQWLYWIALPFVIGGSVVYSVKKVRFPAAIVGESTDVTTHRPQTSLTSVLETTPQQPLQGATPSNDGFVQM